MHAAGRWHVVVAACSTFAALGTLDGDAHAAKRRALIVHAASLGDAAREWREYRAEQGWSITLVPVPADATAPDLLALVQTASRDPGGAPLPISALLVLGDAIPQGDGRVPTFSFPQNDPALLSHQRGEANPTFASDYPLTAPADPSGVPTIAVGRIPVTTNDAARSVLAKVRQYEHASPIGEWRQRITYVAGEPRFGLFDPLFERLFREYVDTFVPPSFDVSMTYAHPRSPWCPPPSRLARTALDRVEDGSFFFVYAGHGYATGLDALTVSGADGRVLRVPILLNRSLDDLQASRGVLPITLLSCCSTGWFDRDDGSDCFAEALLKHANGPVAVVAGSRVTHPYANALVVKEFTRALLGEGGVLDSHPLTLGEFDLRARAALLDTDDDDRRLDRLVQPIASALRWRTSLPDLRIMHVRMYVLLGDPMMPIADPGIEAQLSVAGGTLTAVVPGVASGNVVVHLETERERCVDFANLEPAAPGDDLEARAGANYPRANHRILWTGTTEVRDGAFHLELPTPLPGGTARVRVTGSGNDGTGRLVPLHGGLDHVRRTGAPVDTRSPSDPASRNRSTPERF